MYASVEFCASWGDNSTLACVASANAPPVCATVELVNQEVTNSTLA